MQAELIVIDGGDGNTYKAKFELPQISLAWEKDLDYDFLRKVKRHLKTKDIRMQTPFPNESLFYSVNPDDAPLLANVRKY